MSNHEQIEDEILKMPDGYVFIVSDFANSTSYDNARKICIRLENEGKIRRILPGIYDKPMYSKILNQEVSPDINAVAEAIARKNNWSIIPSGNVALNLLGISTQVPAKWEYFSSGDTKEYQVGNSSIHFIHRADKELNRMSTKTALAIQAIKALGNENVSDEIIAKFADKLTNTEKAQLLAEAKPTTAWIYEMIKKICRN